MKLIKMVAVGLFLPLGLGLSILCVADLLNPRSPADSKEGSLGALLFFGLPPTALGSWCLWSLYQQNQREQQAREKQERDRLQATFYQLIEANSGRITVLKFAKETQLSGEAAKAYLDDKAQEFNANFEVSEQGDMAYRFPL